MTTVELLGRLEGVRRNGDGWVARCPGHEDKVPSLSVTEGRDGRILLCCFAGCTAERIVGEIGLEMRDLFADEDDRPVTVAAKQNGYRRPSVEEHAKFRAELLGKPKLLERLHAVRGYTAAALDLLQVGFDGDRLVIPVHSDGDLAGFVRYAPNPERRGDGPKMKADTGTPRLLFPGTIPDGDVFLVEGEPDCIAVTSVGIAAVAVPGVKSWKREWADRFTGRSVTVCFDCDQPGREAAQRVAADLHTAGVPVRVLELGADRNDGFDVGDIVKAAQTDGERGGARTLLLQMAEAAPLWQPEPGEAEEARSVALNVSAGSDAHDVADVFERWLHLPDRTALYAILGTVAANLLPGDPVWLLLVGSPGCGKSELVQPLGKLGFIRFAATLTEAALLSGTATKDKAKDAKGGLLREIGEFGVVACKDFGSVLNMHRDARAQLLAALRECYDGSWTRLVGTDGGRTLSWAGKLGFIGACTQAIDRHHAVMASMGERFVLLRMPTLDAATQAARAMQHGGREKQMRQELADAVAELFARGLPAEPQPLNAAEEERMISLSTFTARARSAVERDGYTREIELVPEPEAPTRLVLVLCRLLGGLDAIGLTREESWPIIAKVALDSVPAIRLKLIVALASVDTIPTGSIAAALDYPVTTVRRTLEDLAAHKVARRFPQGKGQSDLWALTDWTRDRLAEIRTVPEMSEDMAGTVPEMSERLREATVPEMSEDENALNLFPKTLKDISGTPPATGRAAA